ncbi:MAG: hypothetical protein ACRD0P_16180 [Stackebrandtia sp.]
MTEGPEERDEAEDRQRPGNSRRWFVLSGVVAMLVALCLVAYLGGWFTEQPEDTNARPSAEVSDEDIQFDFDINSAEFFLSPDNRPYYLYGDRYSFDLDERQPPAEPVQLTDGVYYPKEGDSGTDPHVRVAEGTKPILTDVNGDSNTDAVAVLEYTGTPNKRHTAWKGVYIWLRQNGQAVPVQRMVAWQWMDCPGESDLRLEQDGLSRLPRVTRTGDGNCDGEKNDSQGENPQPQTIYVSDGVPVSVGHATGIVDRCYFFDMYKKDDDYTVTAEVTPRLAPDANAAPVDGTVLTPSAGGKVKKSDEKQTIDQIQLRIGPKPDKKLYEGWIPANIVWTGENQPISCGWVNWADIGKKYKKD